MSSATDSTPYSQAYLKADRGYQQIVVALCFGVPAFITCMLRVVARKVNKIGLWIDDYLIMAAMFFALGLIITVCMLPSYGVGHHIQAVSAKDLETMGKITLANEISYIPAISLAKLSICAIYARIFRNSKRWFHYANCAIAVYIILWTIGMFLDIFLVCQPLHSMWTGGCLPTHADTISTSVLNVVSDFALFLLPQPIVWRLQMPLGRRIVVSALFLLGFAATAVSIARIPLVLDTSNSGDPDVTWTIVTGEIMTVIEPLVVILCANLPVVQLLVRRVDLFHKKTTKDVELGVDMDRSSGNSNSSGSNSSISSVVSRVMRTFFNQPVASWRRYRSSRTRSSRGSGDKSTVAK